MCAGKRSKGPVKIGFRFVASWQSLPIVITNTTLKRYSTTIYNTFTHLNPQTYKYNSFLLNNENRHLQIQGNGNLTVVCMTDPLASQRSQFHKPFNRQCINSAYRLWWPPYPAEAKKYQGDRKLDHHTLVKSHVMSKGIFFMWSFPRGYTRVNPARVVNTIVSINDLTRSFMYFIQH